MEEYPLHHYSAQALDSLLETNTFYRQVKQNSSQQYALLLQYSRMREYHLGEAVIELGHADDWRHFLLKGQLAVFAGRAPSGIRRVNTITAGEVFGDLAALTERPRTASVLVDTRCRRALVFSTDFSIFGHLEDFRRIHLTTKLWYYRNLVHSLRWKLDSYRARYPHFGFSASHHKVKLFSGPQDTLEELLSLDSQARQLAHLLVEWNSEFTRETPPQALSFS